MTWQIALVQAGQLEQHEHNGKPWETAIYKRPIAGPVTVQKLGIVGDEHTGNAPDPDRAVCVHSAAHYDFWRAYFRRDIPLGFFGENLTINGALDEEMCVGDVVRCGTTLLQVTQPRTPCFKQAHKLGVPSFVKLIMQTGKLGFLLRVLEPGVLQTGDMFELVERPHPEANLVYVNRIRYDRTEHAAVNELASLAPMADEWRRAFREKVSPSYLEYQTTDDWH